MVRLHHVSDPHHVNAAFDAASASPEPVLVVVLRPDCGHCIRLMPAYLAMLRRLGSKTPNTVLQIDAGAMQGYGDARINERPSDLAGRIRLAATGVPFIAAVKTVRSERDGRIMRQSIVQLPDSNDRSTESLTAFASKHFAVRGASKTGGPLRSASRQPMASASAVSPNRKPDVKSRRKLQQKRNSKKNAP